MNLKRIIALICAMAIALALTACGDSGTRSNSSAPASEPSSAVSSEPSGEDSSAVSSEGTGSGAEAEEVTIYIDIAASLEAVFVDVIIPAFEEENPNVTVVYNTGSSGKLLTQIEEANGIGHDLFFSAGKSQVTTLNETDGLVIEGSVIELLSNAVCLVKGVGTETEVTGWDTLDLAKTMALCGGSVPVGKYSRLALVSLGYLDETESPADYTTEEIAAALGGVEIDEADDVEVAASKAVEHSVEVATIYYSDYYNHQEDLEIIAMDSAGELTGNIIYPVCLVANPEATEAQQQAAADLQQFLCSELSLSAFEEYCFVVNAG